MIRALTPAPPAKRRWVALLALGGALSLTACTPEVKPHEYPAADLPKLSQVGAAFTGLKWGDIELHAHSEGDSEQLLQQADAMSRKIAEGEFKVTPATCKSMLNAAYDSRFLRWDSIFATSPDDQNVAQVFLAPSAQAATEAVEKIAENIAACPEVTVEGEGVTSVVSTSAVESEVAGTVAFRQDIVRPQESFAVVAYFHAHDGILLSLAAQNVASQAERQVETMNSYAQRYLEVLSSFKK